MHACTDCLRRIEGERRRERYGEGQEEGEREKGREGDGEGKDERWEDGDRFETRQHVGR